MFFKKKLLERWVETGAQESAERGNVGMAQHGKGDGGEKWSDLGSVLEAMGNRPTWWILIWGPGKKSKQGFWVCLGLYNLVNEAEMGKTKIKGWCQMLKEKWSYQCNEGVPKNSLRMLL